MTTSSNYPGKILLLGEYTVLDGGRALAIPAPNWFGHFVESDEEPDPHLTRFAEFINAEKLEFVDGEKLLRDVEQGLRFDSNIPTGYGLGSSGAVTAAIYSQYSTESDLLKLDNDIHKQRLAAMESCFHGNSSGLDPLISFLRRPQLVEQGSSGAVDLEFPESLKMFMLDSGTPRQTELLVKEYREMSINPEFRTGLISPLKQAVDHAIEFLLNGHIELFWPYLDRIAQLQRSFLEPMIPQSIMPAWDAALSSDNIRIKLCGAGGGGYFLGFTTGSLEDVGDVLGAGIITV